MPTDNPFASLSSEQQVASLSDCVLEILSHYGLAEAEFESINHEFNSTFKVTAADSQKFALRININSHRSPANLFAEVSWVASIRSVRTPKPQLNRAGEYITHGWHEASGRRLDAVLYSWLDGQELGDEPTAEQMWAAGAAMALLQAEARTFELPPGAELPGLADFFWGSADLLLGPGTQLDESEQALVSAAKARIEHTIAELALHAAQLPIHADMHPWNLMWHEGELAVFDFDDSGIGMPVHDLATALYYLDTDEQRQALLDGFASVAPLPEHTPTQLQDLLLQRRIFLLNSLYETSTPHLIGIIPDYKAETMRRIQAALA